MQHCIPMGSVSSTGLFFFFPPPLFLALESLCATYTGALTSGLCHERVPWHRGIRGRSPELGCAHGITELGTRLLLSLFVWWFVFFFFTLLSQTIFHARNILLGLKLQHRSSLSWAPPWMGVGLLLKVCFPENKVG